jgi:hypothetical protein
VVVGLGQSLKEGLVRQVGQRIRNERLDPHVLSFNGVPGRAGKNHKLARHVGPREIVPHIGLRVAAINGRLHGLTEGSALPHRTKQEREGPRDGAAKGTDAIAGGHQILNRTDDGQAGPYGRLVSVPDALLGGHRVQLIKDGL